ncbi:lethal 2 06225 [Echinococcus multilocularis]|uniref:Lethal 2 06225 n=1 Tax=Echinococcus multilocularis TaxID=6211 RepID=A0A087VZ89_ECHMU|nr:lethal 2 06225 [Echinococcus multilocularis]
MAKLLKWVVSAGPKYATLAYRYGMERGCPAIAKFYKYAKVELRPPTMSELTPALEEGKSIINFFKSGAWKQKTVKDFALDSAVAIEVLMWFFVGEIIGRRSLIGYKKVKGAYIVAH